MILEVLDKPILVNGDPFIQDLRLNFPGGGKKQFRLKLKYIEADKLEPVDLVVFNFGDPSIEKLSLGISLQGKEMIKNIEFDLKVSYALTASKWKLRGKFGNHTINKELSSITEILSVIKGLI